MAGGDPVHGRPPVAHASDFDAEASRSGRIGGRLGSRRRREVDGRTAEGAGWGGSEPGVDALGVEGVAACWKEAKLVVRVEVGEANGAVERLGFLEGGHGGGEGEDREG
ncbi:hypothetical protein IEQ34_014162 [Dendrobium chrysotoxum]|uniref:Uncharacterized protein n=1 Tax=Dendrobium chrysotoxum TaxID=161865 RepID=A0AAV7G2A8_DENCH|nr:hypothetical protein IEQ34_014162 [Dendrobium chrysotoxum]